MAKIIEKYIKKYILHILFIICCYLTIRWSDLPVINIKIFEKIFVHTKEVDAAVLNVVTGYITGYIVYLITVFLPTIKRNKPVKKIVMERITIINQEAIYLLLLIYKNCCTEIEWEQVYAQQKKDTACFNDLFFERMKKFDVTADADTILLHSENRTPLKWYEYLEYRYDKIYQELDELFLHYHMYLDDETIDIITEIKDCRFFDM